MEQPIADWVNEGTSDRVSIKQRIHIILEAIAYDDDLSQVMVLKGGILMSMKFGNDRHTKDVDFSFLEDFSKISDDPDSFIEEIRNSLNGALKVSCTTLSQYGLIAKVQKIEKKPQKDFELKTFPALQIKIGFAEKSNSRQVRKLEESSASDTISIDYSLNEYTAETSQIDINLEDDTTIHAYSLVEMVAEKYRSCLEQKVRNRKRYQDIYDLFFLIGKYQEEITDSLEEIRQILLDKSVGKGLDDLLNAGAFLDPEIKQRSADGYNDLKYDVKDLPNFEEAYKVVADFYVKIWNGK